MYPQAQCPSSFDPYSPLTPFSPPLVPMHHRRCLPRGGRRYSQRRRTEHRGRYSAACRRAGRVEIGYWIHASYVGQGLATAVARLLTAAAFSVPGITHVEIAVSCSHAFILVRSYLRTSRSPRGWRCRMRDYAVLLDCRRNSKIVTVYDSSYGE